MSKSSLAGAASLLAAPIVVVLGILVAPTVSDEAADRVAALTDHRNAAIAGATLQTIALVLLMAGTAWLALSLAGRAPRLALAGGVLGLLGSFVILFEDGISAAAPSVVAALEPAQATAALDRIGSSAAVSALEPLSLVGSLGLALLGVAAARSGAARWTAVAVTVGAFGETAGFASATRPLIVAGFAVLFVGLVAIVRALGTSPSRRLVAEAAAA